MLRWIHGFALASVHGIAVLPAVSFFQREKCLATLLSSICMSLVILVLIYFMRYLFISPPHPQLKQVISNWFHEYLSVKEEKEDLQDGSFPERKLLDRDILETEVTALAESFHTYWVAPSFSVISADHKYSREIKCVFEDTLLNVLNGVNNSVTPFFFFQTITNIFAHHCKCFQALFSELVPNSKFSLELMAHFSNRLEMCYKPTHPALRKESGLLDYCKKWTQAVLLNHMPEEVSSCPPVTLIIRDFISEWLFRFISNDMCKPYYLISCTIPLIKKVEPPKEFKIADKNSPDVVPYKHSLSMITEENSIDLQDIEIPSEQPLEDMLQKRLEKYDRKILGKRIHTPLYSVGLGKIAENRNETEDKCVASALMKCISTTAGPIVAEPTRLTLFELNPFSDPYDNNRIEQMQWKSSVIALEAISFKLSDAKAVLRRSCSHQSFLCKNQLKKPAHCVKFQQRSFSLRNLMTLPIEEPHRERKLQKMPSFEREDSIDIGGSTKREENLITSPSTERSQNEMRSNLTLNELSSSTDISQALAASNSDSAELSPIYEESEDLASSIAKLRSLLSERQSQHSLGSQSSFGSIESEPKSAQSDPGRYNLEKSRFNFFHKDSSGSLTSVKSFSSTDSYSQVYIEEDLPEASEVPLDGRIFINISIPSSETHTESNGIQYFLYVIHYDAIYSYEVASCFTDPQAAAESAKMQETKMILQTNVVRRRFCEFLDLHATIEGQPSLKAVLKGIKAPSKWLNLSFSKLDSASSKTLLLEKYLQSLIQRTELNVSSPVREFLAYGSDSPDMFIKKPVEISVPRLDKLLARKVSGVFHSLKTALPSFETTESSGTTCATGCQKPLPSYSEKHTDLLKPSGEEENDLLLDVTAEDDICLMEEWLKTSTQEESQRISIELAKEAQETLPPPQSTEEIVSKLEAIIKSNGGSSFCESPTKNVDGLKTNTQENVSKENLWQNFEDCLIEINSMSENSWKGEICLKAISNWIGEELSHVIKKNLESMCNRENLSSIFEYLRRKLKSSHSKHESSMEDSEFSPQALTADVLASLPERVFTLCGVSSTEEVVDLLIGSFASSTLNQELCLNLLDALLARIVSS